MNASCAAQGNCRAKLAIPACVFIVLLGGCASQSVTIRSLPAETPAADAAAAALAAAANTAAVRPAGMAADGTSPERPTADMGPPVTPAQAPSMRTYDPWERFNRFNYRFNARFDEAVFLPVANGYRRLPSPLRSGVHNFFDNLAEIDSVINYVLQGRLGSGVRSLGRLVINSTVGIGGLIDVATRVKLKGAPTGFSNTLSSWGVHPGPYLVIPLLGPSTLRDGVGLLADYGTSYAINLANLYKGDESWPLGGVHAVDERANVDFRYYSTGSPFEYEEIRFLYVRKRLIEDEGLRGKGRAVTAPDVPAGR
jgi:phospholipid-binding lipoprotein MlaA